MDKFVGLRVRTLFKNVMGGLDSDVSAIEEELHRREPNVEAALDLLQDLIDNARDGMLRVQTRAARKENGK